MPEEPAACLGELVMTVIVLAMSHYMYVSVNTVNPENFVVQIFS